MLKSVDFYVQLILFSFFFSSLEFAPCGMIVKRVLDAILVFVLIICLNLYLCDFSPWMVSGVLWGAVWCHVIEGCNWSDLDWNGRQKVFCFIYSCV